MFKMSLRTSTLIAITFLVAFVLGHITVSSQERQPEYLKFPKAWGSVKAFNGQALVLEDANGTIRIINMNFSASGVYRGRQHIAEIRRE